MLIAVFADVHGNLPALELFLKNVSHADGYICLGDLVNYGPWSNECVERVERLSDKITIIGNHEEYFIKGKYGGTNETAKAFFDYCIKDFSEQETISGYIDSYRQNGFLFVHTLDNRIIFPDIELSLIENTVLAHSHKQFNTAKTGYRLINPGSVGQNRTYINVINYMLWDTEKDVFTEKQILYNPDIVINEMKAKKYPSICIDYYQNKKRL